MASRRTRPARKRRQKTSDPLGPVPADSPTPRVSIGSGAFASARADAAVCFAHAAASGNGSPKLVGLASGSALSRTLTRVMRDGSFRGKQKEVLEWASGGRFPAGRYLLVGLGPASEASADAVREGAAIAAGRLRKSLSKGGRRAVVLLPEAADAAGMETLARAATEGVTLGGYRMTKYLTDGKARSSGVKAVDLHVPRAGLAHAKRGVGVGTIRARATNLARDIVNEPAGTLTPTRMAAVARDLAKRTGMTITVLDKRALERMGMGAILGVSAGSAQPPCLIHMIYRPAGKPAAGRRRPRVALVGKGLTFDSGGLSLKTASGMETMKLDKAGASAVLGVMSALPDLKPDVEVHGIMAMAENMPGGSATKPGDVLLSFGGKTIEVLNTDAEGRVVLADALVYAQKQKVDRIIDLATLTGACVVALGPIVTGVFGNDQAMVDDLLAASREAGEMMWQLPLCEEYADQIKSDVADVKNTPGTRYGGAITAGLFLRSFVEDAIPWIHLDIAGPAFYESERGAMRKGGTGVAVRTLLTYLGSI